MSDTFKQALAAGDLGDAVKTLPGQIIVWAIVIVLMGVLFAVSTKNRDNKSSKQLTYSAIAIALGTVLSMIKILSFPQGGSITLCSMLMIVLVGYWFGPTQGVIGGMVYGFVQVALGGYIVSLPQIFLEYPIAFGFLGLAGGIFSKSESGLIKGYILGIVLRFAAHVLAGVVFFAEYAGDVPVLTYSIGYNITYIAGEAFITALVLLIPSFVNAMKIVKRNALS